MRIRVSDVSDHLARGLSRLDVPVELPDLADADIAACLRVASRRIDHPVPAAQGWRRAGSRRHSLIGKPSGSGTHCASTGNASLRDVLRSARPRAPALLQVGEPIVEIGRMAFKIGSLWSRRAAVNARALRRCGRRTAEPCLVTTFSIRTWANSIPVPVCAAGSSHCSSTAVRCFHTGGATYSTAICSCRCRTVFREGRCKHVGCRAVRRPSCRHERPFDAPTRCVRTRRCR